MRIRKMLALTSIAAALCALPACGKSDPGATTEANAEVEASVGKEVVIEKHEGGSAAFHVAADGSVKAVASVDGKVKPGVTGSLAWKDGAEVKTIPLAADAKTNVLVAAGPKLTADITEIGYTLSVDGKPWSGTLHVPAGGTAALTAEADANVEAAASVSGKVGPHGGSIHVVGKDRLEIVANAEGELRVYVLGPDLEIQAVGDRKITIAFVAETPEIVVLVPEPGGLYFTGKVSLKEDPIKITIAVRSGAEVRCALAGWRSGAHVVVAGPGVVRVKVKVKAEFDEDIDAQARVKLKADLRGPKVDVKVKGPDANAKVDVKVKAPKVDIDLPKPDAKVDAKAGAKAGAGAGAGAKAGAKAGVKIGF
jgi:hypothetical protein